MWLNDPLGGKVSGAIVSFAGDIFKKHVIATGKASEASAVLKQSTDILNERLAEIGLKQNTDKREIVPRLRGREDKQMARDTNGKEGRITAWARHLG